MIPMGTITAYYRANRDLIPISKSDPHAGKRPLHTNWTNRQYSRAEIRRYARNGFNLGWRLGETDLVIDIDPRNGGNESIETLLAEIGLDFETLTSEYPTVQTGGGGYHVYTTLPTDTRTNETYPGKPGIEFKRRNRQVIIPGSIHPTSGKSYSWFNNEIPTDTRAPIIPTELLQWLVDHTDQSGGTSQGAPTLTPNELAEILDVIPATDYAENERWFKIMCAAHSATGGAGLGEFLDWSLSDPAYVEHESLIKSRWRSLKTDKQTQITSASLLQAAAQYDPARLHAVTQKHIKRDFDPVEIGASKADPIESLTPESKPAEIERAIRSLIGKRALEQNKQLDRIRKKTHQTKAALKESLKELQKDRRRAAKVDGKQDALEDIAQKTVSLLLKTRYENGRTLLHAADQRFWYYTGRYWKLRPHNLVHKDLLEAIESLKKAKPDLEFLTSAIMSQAEKILAARVATDRDMYRLAETQPSVINFRNFEVWIDTLSGKLTPKPHNPESYLINCLDIDYDPEAKAPLFEETIDGIAAKEPNPADWQRHLYELLGYVIQPLKDIAIWCLFQGYGSNGKSFVLNILSHVLGEAALEKSVKELSSDYAHAYADLPGKLAVIDEDVRAGTLLPDDTLKKVSENKVLSANPKYTAQFKFRNSAVIIMASNSWPQTRDLSAGLKRRAMVVPFRNQFSVTEMDTRRAQRVIDSELPAVMNILLAGLQRLRKRGIFDPPHSCTVAAEQWITESHPFNAFLAEKFENEKDATTPLIVAWNAYTNWTIENQIQKPLSKISFGRAIKQCGYTIRRGGKGKYIIEGLRYLPDENEKEARLW